MKQKEELELEEVTISFFNKYKEIKMRSRQEGNNYNLKSLYYNYEKNKGAYTIIKKGNSSNKYNEQDYPIVLISPGVMKIEQFFKQTSKTNNTYYLFVIEEILSNFKHLNKTLHEDGYLLLKINNEPFNEIMGNNLLKYFIRQLIYLLEFVDRNNLYFEDLTLENFFVSKKDFLLRLYIFKNIVNLDDFKKPSEKKSIKKLNKNRDLPDEKELRKKNSYNKIGMFILNLIFGNVFHKNEKETSEFSEDKNVDLIINYIKKLKEKNINENLKDLIIKLLDFDPKNRPSIEEIFRNKWIHEDYHIIDDIISNFEKDILKIILEFAKYDYLKRLEFCLENNRGNSKNIKNIINNNNNIITKNKKGKDKKIKIIKTGRFIYKKRIKKK